MVQFVRSGGRADARVERLLRDVFHRALAQEGFPNHAVRVVWISEKQSAMVNDQMKKKKVPGDVFSYPRAEGKMLGEILMAPNFGRKVSKKLGCHTNDLLVRWGVHGLFHILGYDHETPEDYSWMIQKERHLISAVGREFIEL